MSLPKTINIFDEFNNCPANAGLIETGGVWSLETAPFPVTLCISCAGNVPANYNDIEFTAADDFCISAHDPWIDFSGDECSISQAPDGVYVFKYTITGACPSESFFTLNVVDGNITADFVRIPEVCYVEAYSHREGDEDSRQGTYLVTNNRPTVELSFRFKAEVFDLEDCAKPLTTICSENIKTPHINKENSTFTIDPGQPITYPWLATGIVLWHRYEVDINSWDFGGKIQHITVRSSTQGIRDLDLSGVTYPGPPGDPVAQQAYVVALKAEILTQLIAEFGSTSVTNLTVVYEVRLSGSSVQIDFLCMNVSGTEWIGIDKNDTELFICQQAGDCDIDCLGLGTCDFFQVMNIPTVTTTCEIEDCDNYDKHLAGQNDCMIQLFNRICHNGTNILNLDNCNYNTLTLASAPRANVLDFDDLAGCNV